MERDKEIILDIKDAINKIFSYTTNVNFDDFVANDEKQDAVIRRIMIIGEATKRLSNEFKANYPDIPWREMMGMRDILVHEYNRVDLETVWDVVQNDLPQLIELFNLIL